MTEEQVKLREEHLQFLQTLKKKKSKLKQNEHRAALAFISVKYLGLILFTIIPVFIALLYSFMNFYGGMSFSKFFRSIGDKWVWFDNYKALFTNISTKAFFLNAIKNNLIFMLSVPLGIFIGLVVAVMLSKEDKIHGSRVIRMLIYIPVVSSAVAMNIIWRYMFDNEFGIVNKAFGLSIKWMTDDNWIKVAIIIKSAWGSIGKTMILCLAALTNVGRDYYEAADLDGAGEITKFFKISLPLISPTLFYLLTTGFIANLQSYVDADVFAKGDFGAHTIVYFIWQFGISMSRYGIASAASFILTISIMVITLVQFKISDKWVYGE